MRRVVVTGLGIVSPLGNQPDQVAETLRQGRACTSFVEEFAGAGLRSRVAGIPDLHELPTIDRKLRRFMGDGAVYAYHAMCHALADAAFPQDRLSGPDVGLIAGSGVGSTVNHIGAIDTLRQRGAGRIPPYVVPQVMGNTISALLATAFHIKGVSYSIVSACASSAHCIGNAFELIAHGKQDVVFAGGAEEASWPNAACFDAMGVLSSSFNATPEQASRPYDQARDGFVLAGGGGMLVLEELVHARKRGAKIYAEVAGYGACSDGHDMVTPSQAGAARVMRIALEQAGVSIDYVNTHGTSTPLGDVIEVRAMKDVFGATMPKFSSTKGLSGHAIAAAGVHEAIYSLLMMRDGFLAGAANVQTPDAALAGLPLLRESIPFEPDAIMSNSFGFGGTNASLVFRRFTS